jgi:hypothetical protein
MSILNLESLSTRTLEIVRYEIWHGERRLRCNVFIALPVRWRSCKQIV